MVLRAVQKVRDAMKRVEWCAAQHEWSVMRRSVCCGACVVGGWHGGVVCVCRWCVQRVRVDECMRMRVVMIRGK